MDRNHRDRILVVDNNPIFRETLAQWLHAAGFDVSTADTGEHAFFILRDWQHPIDWLYARAGLPILIDGWILADEYHDTFPTRPAVIAAAEARSSSSGDIILGQPSPAAVLEVIRQLISASHNVPAPAEISPTLQQHAA
jgi:CheY-like chemotaxis protein